MKISFCTTCMNRIEHLKETLPHNIELINKFGGELVLVNYDSKDEMDEYVTTNYDLCSSIKYIKVTNKKFFDRFHAKNIAHRFTNGDILVNLDVDNFLTEEVITFILSKFTENMNYVLQYTHKFNEGFIAISKENFFKLGGYIEEMKNWGYEDNDLIIRAKKYLNCDFISIDEDLVSFINHSVEMREDNLEGKETGENSYHYNIEVCNRYLDQNIINPNSYNNVDWGKIV